jgi:uncharacterized protein YjdB
VAYRHKLSCRLALLRDLLVLLLPVAVGVTCERPLAAPSNQPPPAAQIVVVPESLTVDPSQQVRFLAYGRTGAGDSIGVAVAWSTTGGTVTSDGMFTADTLAGDFLVTATSAQPKLSGASRVHNRGRPPVASVTVSPAAASVTIGQTVQLAAVAKDSSGNPLTGRSITWSSGTQAVATVSGSGLVTGAGAGAATITGASGGKSGTATITVTVVPVATVMVSPATANIMVGNTVQLTATPKDANGNVLTGLAVTWASNNGGVATVSGTGLVTALAAGTVIITAACEGKSGAATVTATNVPVASVTVSPATASVQVGQTVQLTATPKDATGNPLSGRVITWATSNAAVATVSGGLVSGGAVGLATITATSEGQSGTAAVTVTPLSGGGTILFQETFEDQAFASRGWYDNTSVTITANQFHSGTHAMEAHFLLGADTPTWGGSMRHLFQATPTLYVSYWVKYSSNWVGSGQLYQPHEFTMMSDLDGDYDGPSDNYLTVYLEHNYQNGGIPRLVMQDNKSINTSYGTPPINLIGLTENRSTAGCNGVVEVNVVTSCYNAPPWYNAKELHASQVAFQPTPGPGYKGNWNHVEAYYQINSIVNGVGQADGVMQYWFNGTLMIDRHDILYRAGGRPSINFHQFLIAPYIGDGSPVDQYMWVDDLTVATSKP